jgi:hypothetical protein
VLQNSRNAYYTNYPQEYKPVQSINKLKEERAIVAELLPR